MRFATSMGGKSSAFASMISTENPLRSRNVALSPAHTGGSFAVNGA